MTTRTFEDFANSGEINSIYIGGTDAATDKVMTSGAIAISEDWLSVTVFANSWVAEDITNNPIRYKILKDKIVLLEGTIYSGTVGAGLEAFTLPNGYRPLKEQRFLAIASGDSIVTVYVGLNGKVTLESESGSGATTWTSLSGITFLAEA